MGEGVDDTVDDYYGYDDYDDYDDDGGYYYYYDYETTTTETGNTDQETSTDTTTGDQETSTDTDQATTTGYSMSSTDSNGNTKRRKKRESTSQRSKTHRRRASAPVKKNTKDGLRTTTAANSLLGLSVVLYANQFQYSDVVMNNYYGFKVLVHSPYDFPGVGAKGFAVGGKKTLFWWPHARPYPCVCPPRLALMISLEKYSDFHFRNERSICGRWSHCHYYDH